MAVRLALVAAALAMLTAASAQGATLYDCRGTPSAKAPDKTTIAMAVVDSSGAAIGMDAWSHDEKTPDKMWSATVHRNDAEAIELRWTTEPERSTQGAYMRLRISLKVRKSDLSFKLALTGPDIREQHLTGTCVKSAVEDFARG